MRKVLNSLLILALVVLFTIPANASTINNELKDYYKRGMSQLDLWNLLDALRDDVMVLERDSIQFQPDDFIAHDDGNVVRPISWANGNSAPSLTMQNNNVCLVWQNGVTSKAQVKIRVPNDYVSGAAFRAFVNNGDATTYNMIDYEFYVNNPDTAFDTAPSSETPVIFYNAVDKPGFVTFSTTNISSEITTHSVITLNIWRAPNTLTGNTMSFVSDLELFYLEFYYNHSTRKNEQDY